MQRIFHNPTIITDINERQRRNIPRRLDFSLNIYVTYAAYYFI